MHILLIIKIIQMFENKDFYKTSHDFKKLLELLKKGNMILCIVDSVSWFNSKKKHVMRTICVAKRRAKYEILFGVPSIQYGGISNYDNDGTNKTTELKLFSAECRRLKLEWIVSN